MADSDVLHDTDIEQEVGTEAEAAIEPPYRIFVHNDDVTPFDFVIIALQRFFDLTLLAAEQVTYIAHVSGLAYVCLLYTSDAADERSSVDLGGRRIIKTKTRAYSVIGDEHNR